MEVEGGRSGWGEGGKESTGVGVGWKRAVWGKYDQNALDMYMRML